jgi:hypothetical protein
MSISLSEGIREIPDFHDLGHLDPSRMIIDERTSSLSAISHLNRKGE